MFYGLLTLASEMRQRASQAARGPRDPNKRSHAGSDPGRYTRADRVQTDGRMESTVTSDGEPMGAAGRGVEQNQRAHDDLRAGSYRGFLIGSPGSTVFLVLFLCL